jgi:hypothetical protein
VSIQITVTLADKLYQSAQEVAHLTGRPVEDVIAETIEIGLPLREAASAPPVEGLSDQEVMQLTALQMDEVQSERLSLLLDHQQAGKLTDAERIEMRALMQIYEDGLLRKAQGLAEAVNRKLIPPLGA